MHHVQSLSQGQGSSHVDHHHHSNIHASSHHPHNGLSPSHIGYPFHHHAHHHPLSHTSGSTHHANHSTAPHSHPHSHPHLHSTPFGEHEAAISQSAPDDDATLISAPPHLLDDFIQDQEWEDIQRTLDLDMPQTSPRPRSPTSISGNGLGPNGNGPPASPQGSTSPMAAIAAQLRTFQRQVSSSWGLVGAIHQGWAPVYASTGLALHHQ